ncbi:hypothetical protein TNCV_2087401, partial [Trichonephila clavipes]
ELDEWVSGSHSSRSRQILPQRWSKQSLSFDKLLNPSKTSWNGMSGRNGEINVQ